MGSACQHMKAKAGGFAAQALGANACCIHQLKQFILQGGIVGIAVVLTQRHHQGTLGQQGNTFKVAADADAQHHGRAGIGSCFLHRFQHKVFHAFHPLGRGQHGQAAHVFTAEAFGCYRQGHLIPRHKPGVNNSRGVVPGIDPAQRIPHHALAQQAVGVPGMHAGIDRLLKVAVNVHILTNIRKHHRHARILTDGHLGVSGDLLIFLQ